ncbi:MAG TPA: hypothetical protein VL688_11950 [Verrucomicrobiae bacterium]|nr:hypothetical protein [Verrucomicrobiae bacterium]
MKKAILISLCVLAAGLPLTGCRKKPLQEQPPAKQEAATLKLLKKAGLEVYPKSEILDQSLKNQETEKLYGANPEAKSEVTVARVWAAVDAPVEEVRAYYAKTHPYVLRDEHKTDGTEFIQLSSVEKIASAITEGVTPITLVDIRKNKLTADERTGYEGELKALQEKKGPDLVDENRIKELQRLLAEKTIVKLSLRAEKPS